MRLLLHTSPLSSSSFLNPNVLFCFYLLAKGLEALLLALFFGLVDGPAHVESGFFEALLI